MYIIKKRIEISSSHCLNLPYQSKCSKPHGHNWIIEVEISGEFLNEEGLLIDFTHIKEVVMQLDHTNINEVIKDKYPLNPTAENLAVWIADKINNKIFAYWTGEDEKPTVTKVTVQESEGNTACYIP